MNEVFVDFKMHALVTIAFLILLQWKAVNCNRHIVLDQIVESCIGNNSLVVFTSNVTKRNGKVFLSAQTKLMIPIGDNSYMKASMSVAGDQGKYYKVYQVKENDVCKTYNKYLGQMWYDVERAIHIVQIGYCPIPKGIYNLKDFEINFNRLTFQSIPKGKLKIIYQVYLHGMKEPIICRDVYLSVKD